MTDARGGPTTASGAAGPPPFDRVVVIFNPHSTGKAPQMADSPASPVSSSSTSDSINAEASLAADTQREVIDTGGDIIKGIGDFLP